MKDLNKQTMEIIEAAKLFYRKDIVECSDNFTIFNWNKPDTQLPKETQLFIDYGILVIDSGNFETGEQCYRLETKKEELRKSILGLSQKKDLNLDGFKHLIRDKKISQILES